MAAKKATQRETNSTASTASNEPDAPWWQSSFAYSAYSGLLLWAAHPPLGWWPLGWIAPVFWLLLIRRPELSPRRPYWGVWFGGFLHWLVLLHGVRLAHGALYFGWFALSGYLAVYIVLFVALTRIAVHRWRVPLPLAGAVVWTGLELARGHLLTGFSLALLAHTQVAREQLIQIADIAGAYGVSFVLVLFAASLVELSARWFAPSTNQRRWAFAPPLVALAVVMAVLAYGSSRQKQSAKMAEQAPLLHILLIQGSSDTMLSAPPKRNVETFIEYRDLTLRALQQHPTADLVVWPESMFTANVREMLYDTPPEPPPGMPLDIATFHQRLQLWVDEYNAKCRMLAQQVNAAAPNPSQVSLLLGSETEEFVPGGSHLYNAAILLDAAGQVTDRYYKMHPVMFGEYIPFGRLIPWLYTISPMRVGLTEGPAPRVIDVKGCRIAPNICFESTVPHLIRKQVTYLRRHNTPPHVLVNVTNDGWFRGTNVLDLHFACSVFRAVENRLPVLVAANTGFSAWIDGNGVVLDKGPRRNRAVISVQLRADNRTSLYQQWGDLFAGTCLALCLALALVGAAPRLRSIAEARGRNRNA